MRSVYRQTYDETGARRRKRREDEDERQFSPQFHSQHSTLSLSDNMESIASLANRYNRQEPSLSGVLLPQSTSGYRFEYNASLEHLVRAELVLPVDRLSKSLTINLYCFSSPSFVLIHQQALETTDRWLTIDLTDNIPSLPTSFFITVTDGKQVHPISRYCHLAASQVIIYSDDPDYCQACPLRTSFAELNWTSRIVEPSSYEMNVCSSTCHSASNMRAYFIMQNLLNQLHPHKVPPSYCRPKRFSSTVLLYYDGQNLILKRHDDMRVVECGCA